MKRIRGTVFSLRVSPSISNRIVEKSKGLFLNFIPDVFLSVDHVVGQRGGKSPGNLNVLCIDENMYNSFIPIGDIFILGFGACIVAESTTGVFLTSDVVSTPGHGVKTVAEDLGEKAAFLLLEEICRGGCIDSSFQCLVCLYMALQSKDLSQCLLGPLSPYT